jgi:hypothetical protein
MKLRVRIDKISLHDLNWSAGQRRVFERSLSTLLSEAIASRCSGIDAEAVCHRVESTSMSIGIFDSDNPKLAASALASPLAARILSSQDARYAGATEAGGR